MQHLGNLSPASGAHRARKRLGRGVGSGLGKTAGKGHKGQNARKSGGTRPGFEGGQTPIYRRVPKRGFVGASPKNSCILNLSQLESFADGDQVTPEILVDNKIINIQKGRLVKIKLLGKGTLNKALHLEIHQCSKSAAAAIEQAGGTVKLIAVSSLQIQKTQVPSASPS